MFMCVLLLRVVGSIILSSSPSQLPSPFKAEQQVSSYKCVFYHSTLHYLAVFGEDYESVTATTTFMPYYYMIQCTMLKPLMTELLNHWKSTSLSILRGLMTLTSGSNSVKQLQPSPSRIMMVGFRHIFALDTL